MVDKKLNKLAEVDIFVFCVIVLMAIVFHISVIASSGHVDVEVMVVGKDRPVEGKLYLIRYLATRDNKISEYAFLGKKHFSKNAWFEKRSLWNESTGCGLR